MRIFTRPRAAFLLALLLPLSTAWTESRVLRVWAFDFHPGIFKADSGKIEGLWVDLIDIAAREEGWAVTFEYGSWADGLERAREGSIDLLTSVARSEERETFLDFGKEPLLTVWAEAYVGHDSRIGGILDLKGKRIAVMKGDFNARSFRALDKGFALGCAYVEVQDFPAVLAAVEAGTADAGIVSTVFGISKAGNYKVKGSGIVFNPFDIFLAAPKGKNKDILEAMDGRLAKWRAKAGSPYHAGLERWMRISSRIEYAVPPILWPILAVAGFSLAVSAGFVLLLRRQVNVKTREINDLNRGLEKLVDERTRELMEAQDRLVTSEKLAAYGRLAAELAHEINSPLGAIKSAQESVDEFMGCELPEALAELPGAHISLDIVLEMAERGLASLRARSPEQSDSGARIAMEEELAAAGAENPALFAERLADSGFESVRSAFGDSPPCPACARAVHAIVRARSLVDVMGKATMKASHALETVRSILESDRPPIKADFALLPEMDEAIKRNQDRLQGVAIELQVPPGTVARGDRVTLMTVWSNVVRNAAQAMAGSGKLVISARETPRGVAIDFRDTGPGIPAEIASRIFSPFFTTKGLAEGLGLGLNASRRIARSHGGDVTYASEPGRTTFTVELPSDRGENRNNG